MVIEFRRICSELLSKGRQWLISRRTTGREWVLGLGDTRGLARLGVVTLPKAWWLLAIDGAAFHGFSCIINGW